MTDIITLRTGLFCQVHPVGNEYSRTNKRNWIWIHRPRGIFFPRPMTECIDFFFVDWSRRTSSSLHPHNVCRHMKDEGLTQYCFSGPEEGQVARAKVLTDDLLIVVRQEHAKVAVQVQQQQMELHQAQAQYAAYSAMGVSKRVLELISSRFLTSPCRVMLHPHHPRRHHLHHQAKVQLHQVELPLATQLPNTQLDRLHHPIPKLMHPTGEYCRINIIPRN